MATKILLLILFVITVAEAAVPVPVKWTTATNKTINDTDKKILKAFDSVIVAATPDKKKQVELDTTVRFIVASLVLSEAKHAGDEKKALNIACSYDKAADMVIAAPPADKLKVMQEAFNAAVAPDPAGCPSVDKSFCETYSKIQKVVEKLSTLARAAPPEKMVEMRATKQKYVMDTNINDAYATGDKKKIADVLAAYSKAADAVIAAPPAETFKVLEEAFTAAAHSDA